MLCIACLPQLPREQAIGPQTYRVKTDIRTADFKRNYLLHIPPAYDSQLRLPLVVVVHGAFDTAKGIEKASGFSILADRENFIVMYPNGIGIFGLLQHWNAGHCCGKAAQDRIDDVAYVAASIKDISDRLSIDRDRVYMVGFSNGGMLTHRFCAEKGGLLAGAAVLAGAIGSRLGKDPPQWTMPDQSLPIPLLIMHGLRDAHVPFKGGSLKPSDPMRYYDSVDDAIVYWARQNGCEASIAESKPVNASVTLQQWENCESNQPIWLYTIKDWAHVWPGGTKTAELTAGHPMQNFDAAQLIWNFFQVHAPTSRKIAPGNP
jgi:polyhydroxybutyrate depolymerase